MLDDKFKQIKSKIESDDTLSVEKREKLLKISDELHAELDKLEKTDKQKAHKIAEHAQKTVAKDPSQSETGLKDAIQEFEVSHPNLTRIVQALCAQFGV